MELLLPAFDANDEGQDACCPFVLHVWFSATALRCVALKAWAMRQVQAKLQGMERSMLALTSKTWACDFMRRVFTGGRHPAVRQRQRVHGR